MRPNWIKIVIVLALVWAVIGGSLWFVRSKRATPERIVAFATENQLEGRGAEERARIIEQVAAQVNRLDYEERQRMNNQRQLEGFWTAMTDGEKGRYLDLVLPTGFKQMMENLNKMEPAKRKRMIQKAVDNLRSRDPEGEGRRLSDPQFRKIVDQGMKSFYSEATIEAKMDALPFIEALEQTVKWAR